MRNFVRLLLTLCVLLISGSALAHHGGVSLPFGPGSPVETFSPLTLPEGGFVFGFRTEQVKWKQFDFAEPENKASFSFTSAVMSYGFSPSVMGTMIVPYYVKRQELGSTEGLADVKLMLTYGFHYDPGAGFARNTAEDTAVTMEGKNRTYLSASFMMSLPSGKFHKQINGVTDNGMQPGFGAPAYTFGLAAAHRFGPITLNGDLGADVFTARENFQFGSELRANLAGVYELYGNPNNFLAKLDGVLELNCLHLERDEQNGIGLQATGGNILYLSPGARFSFPSLSNANLGMLVKFPVLKNLNEQGQQQGSEGLEKYRAIMTLTFYF